MSRQNSGIPQFAHHFAKQAFEQTPNTGGEAGLKAPQILQNKKAPPLGGAFFRMRNPFSGA
jgi:hypothetical protein